MSEIISFHLDGIAKSIELDSNAKLLYAIRNDCNTKEVRFGCGAGNCGACTVLIDGLPEQSCTVPNWAVANKTVTTAAGLQNDVIGKLVLQAFIDEQAAQCGYCINGILMSVTALLKKNAKPSKEEINESLNRHLCRCGTHLRIFRAIDRVIHQLAKS
jgi:aerobic-type carbon monoxide dehydrogenase small subunit (CoxS/CutS family)